MLPWLVRWPAWQPCSAACWRALAALAALVFVLGQQAAAGRALADVASPAPQGPAPPIAPCAQPSPAAPSVAEAAGRLLAGAPPGLTVVPLAVGPASLPLAAPGSLQLSQVTLPPGAGADTRSASGPILFYVEAGTITFFASGVALPAAAGDTITVATDEYYTLENTSLATASLLQLGVTPDSTGDVRVAVFDSPREPEPVAAPNQPVSRLLVRTAIAPLSTSDAWLVLACVTLPAPGLAITGVQHPGPAGLWVEAGPLGILPGQTAPTGSCVVFAPQAPHDLRSLASSATALLFAVIPEGGQLWSGDQAAAPGAPLLDDLACGEPGRAD